MKFMSLDQKGKVLAEYIWIDSVGGVRSKTKVSSFFDHNLFHCVLASDVCPSDRDLLCAIFWNRVRRLLDPGPAGSSFKGHPFPHFKQFPRSRLTMTRLSHMPSNRSRNSQSGTSTAHQRVKPVVTTPTSTSALAPSSPIPSVSVTTSSSSAKPGTATAHPTSSTSAMRPPVS